MEFLNTVFLGNTVLAYGRAVIIFAAIFILLRALEYIVAKKLKPRAAETDTKADDFLLEQVEKKLIPLIFISAFFIAVQGLVLSEKIAFWIERLTLIFVIAQLARLTVAFIFYFLESHRERRVNEGRGYGLSVSKGLMTLVQFIVWSIAFIFMLDNLGFNISTFVAGLGITGIAVALAAQTILGDLFNYFVIFFDKPFQQGDFIILGDYLGTVEHIGIKTTRIRSLGGEQIVISNSDLTSSRLRNYKRMQQRRIIFSLGVTYETPSDKLKKIPEMIKETVESVEKTRFDRAHFRDFGDFSLNYEIVYYVLSAEYNDYMDIQQNLNLALKEKFEEESIDFAYPTQLLYVNNAAQS